MIIVFEICVLIPSTTVDIIVLTPSKIGVTAFVMEANFACTLSLIPSNFSATVSFNDENFPEILSFILPTASPAALSFSPIASLIPLNFSAIAFFTELKALTTLSTIGFNAPSLYDFFTNSIALPNAFENASLTADNFSFTAFAIGASFVLTLSTTCPSLPPVI